MSVAQPFTFLCVLKRSYHILRPWARSSNLTNVLIDEPLSAPIQLKNVVLVNKTTRYEYERTISNSRTEEAFQRYIKFLGSDYNKLVERHHQHHKQLDSILCFLKRKDVNVSVVGRSSLNASSLSSADAVITAGGDGTFLQAASCIHSNDIPIIGFNTDPTRSQGHLCLPPDMDVAEVYYRLVSGRFRWLNRHRIEMAVSAFDTVHVTDLHAPGRPSWEYPVASLPPDPDLPAGFASLPSFALNEVFVGETSNAVAAYYEMGVDDAPSTKQKSSGLTVSTGTGSTSWFYTISYLHPQTVGCLMQFARTRGYDIPADDQRFIDDLTNEYNAMLQFSPEGTRMAYAIRDPIINEIYDVPLPRGFCSRVRIKSRMVAGTLVVDGGLSYAFSTGGEVILRIAPPTRALRTVSVFAQTPDPTSSASSPTSVPTSHAATTSTDKRS